MFGHAKEIRHMLMHQAYMFTMNDYTYIISSTQMYPICIYTQIYIYTYIQIKINTHIIYTHTSGKSTLEYHTRS